jgi:hypothetical protein
MRLRTHTLSLFRALFDDSFHALQVKFLKYWILLQHLIYPFKLFSCAFYACYTFENFEKTPKNREICPKVYKEWNEKRGKSKSSFEDYSPRFYRVIILTCYYPSCQPHHKLACSHCYHFHAPTSSNIHQS